MKPLETLILEYKQLEASTLESLIFERISALTSFEDDPSVHWYKISSELGIDFWEVKYMHIFRDYWEGLTVTEFPTEKLCEKDQEVVKYFKSQCDKIDEELLRTRDYKEKRVLKEILKHYNEIRDNYGQKS